MSEKNSNRVEIVDKLTPKGCTAIYSACFIPISLLVTISTLIQAEPPNKYLIIPMFAVVIIIGILIFHYEKKHRTKFCKFYISDEKIEIFIPPGPWFEINWSDITAVFVDKFYKRNLIPSTYSYYDVFPKINFSCKGELVGTIQLRKFHSSKKKEIIKLLKSYSDKLNKNYMGLQSKKSMKDI